MPVETHPPHQGPRQQRPQVLQSHGGGQDGGQKVAAAAAEAEREAATEVLARPTQPPRALLHYSSFSPVISCSTPHPCGTLAAAPSQPTRGPSRGRPGSHTPLSASAPGAPAPSAARQAAAAAPGRVSWQHRWRSTAKTQAAGTSVENAVRHGAGRPEERAAFLAACRPVCRRLLLLQRRATHHVPAQRLLLRFEVPPPQRVGDHRPQLGWLLQPTVSQHNYDGLRGAGCGTGHIVTGACRGGAQRGAGRLRQQAGVVASLQQQLGLKPLKQRVGGRQRAHHRRYTNVEP